jgi:hypothetical protein
VRGAFADVLHRKLDDYQSLQLTVACWTATRQAKGFDAKLRTVDRLTGPPYLPPSNPAGQRENACEDGKHTVPQPVSL